MGYYGCSTPGVLYHPDGQWGRVESDGDDNGDDGGGRHNVEMDVDVDVDWKRLFYFEQRGWRRQR